MESTQPSQKKNLRKLAAPATLVAGIAVGALFSPIGIASAQEQDDTGAETTADESTDTESKEERKAERKAAIAAIAGVSVEDLEAAKEAGVTLAELAEENGVERADLVAGLVAAAEERIDEAVAEGKIDEEKAAEIRAGLEEKVENRVDGVRSEGGKGKRGHHGETTSEDAGSVDTGITAS